MCLCRFFFSSRRRHTRCALVTGVQTCALPISMAWDDGGEILALGEGEALRARYPDAHHIDAHGAVLVPGLIDAHAHLMGLAMALSGVDLVGASSKAEEIGRAHV